MKNSKSISVVPQVRIFAELEAFKAGTITKGSDPIIRLKITSGSFSDLLVNGTTKAELDAFSKLEEGVASHEGNVAVIKQRHLSGTLRKKLVLIVDVYHITPFPEN